MSRILLIDPDTFLGEIYTDALTGAGFTVEHVTNGHEGLRAAVDGPDAVVLDVMIPRMAAFEILERLRETATPTALPIIVMTSLAHRRDIERCQRLGIAGYLLKTHHTPADLVQGVRRALAYS